MMMWYQNEVKKTSPILTKTFVFYKNFANYDKKLL